MIERLDILTDNGASPAPAELGDEWLQDLEGLTEYRIQGLGAPNDEEEAVIVF